MPAPESETPEPRTAATGSDAESVPVVVHDANARFDVAARRLSQRAGAVVAVGDSVARELEWILSFAANTVTAIPSAICGSRPTPDDSSDYPGPDDHPEQDDFTVGSLSRFVAHKNVDVVMRAVSRLHRARLIIGGEGPERARLEALADELDISHRVEFVGWVEPEVVLERCDVLATLDSDRALLAAMARAALEKAAADGGPETMAVAYEAVYRMVAR